MVLGGGQRRARMGRGVGEWGGGGGAGRVQERRGAGGYSPGTSAGGTRGVPIKSTFRVPRLAVPVEDPEVGYRESTAIGVWTARSGSISYARWEIAVIVRDDLSRGWYGLSGKGASY